MRNSIFGLKQLNRLSGKVICEYNSIVQLKSYQKHHVFLQNKEKHEIKPDIVIRTRNLNKCMTVEKSCLQYFQNKIGQTCFFPKYGSFTIIQILPKKGKADTALLIEDIITKKQLTCGIQTKTGDTFNIENWMHPNKFPYIRMVREQWKDIKYVMIFRDRLLKYRKRHLHANLNKLGLNICNQDKGFGEVMCFQDKQDHILGKNFRYDIFYYDSSRTERDFFTIRKLILVDKTFIQNTKMYYDVRPIYNTSGNTQKNLPDIFEGEYQEQLKYINKS